MVRQVNSKQVLPYLEERRVTWGVARLLGFRGVPPRPHASEEVG